tara:strand:+ start:2861 stop:3769 length:909 start_codon:yes stop_codon:yes gene_type:complete
MPKLVVQLSGGLGNQMFQYANARALSLLNNLDLVIDDWSGFYRDHQYKRKYELKTFPIKGRIANFYEVAPFLYVSFRRKFKKKFALPNKFFFGNYLEEQLDINNHSKFFQNDLCKINLNKNTWIKGYWQSPNYFEKYKEVILNELYPSPPLDDNFKSLGREISNSNSLALGLRFYEESKDPSIHSLNKKTKSIFQINNLIKSIRKNNPNIRFFVFCTHRSKHLEEINLPNDTIYVTPEDGYKGTLNNIWLLSQCKHHIFNNSTFYWWGAWLSSKLYRTEKQIIYAADNFINRDGLLKTWNSF